MLHLHILLFSFVYNFTINFIKNVKVLIKYTIHMFSKAMSEMMESYGWDLVSYGWKASPHSSHKTGVSVLDALTQGRSRHQIMEWMLVTDEIPVVRYCEREYIVTPFVATLFDWM